MRTEKEAVDFCLQVMKQQIDKLSEALAKDVFETGGHNPLLGMKTIRPMPGGRAVASERGAKEPKAEPKSTRLGRRGSGAKTRNGEYPR